MSMGDADAKFPGQHTGIPPSPTRENPGQVYPKSDPNPGEYDINGMRPFEEAEQLMSDDALAPRLPQSGDDSRVQTAIGNPFLLQSAWKQVDKGLADVITILEKEERSQGSSGKEDALIRKFRGWRNELNEMMYGTGQLSPEPPDEPIDQEAGGMFSD